MTRDGGEGRQRIGITKAQRHEGKAGDWLGTLGLRVSLWLMNGLGAGEETLTHIPGVRVGLSSLREKNIGTSVNVPLPITDLIDRVCGAGEKREDRILVEAGRGAKIKP
ncbi:hypothetical protein DF3PB_1010004 [uncultured Defluviicoccus sp.]|uniref:Uncharacterized protein n=1 Tax=metagenome TaxID=256318 RepID=A0A380T8D7_9ZZZZ|nr:hypothetical protein DF3PB_1010004 [uncultured Defluviicoccus sp.]